MIIGFDEALTDASSLMVSCGPKLTALGCATPTIRSGTWLYMMT